MDHTEDSVDLVVDHTYLDLAGGHVGGLVEGLVEGPVVGHTYLPVVVLVGFPEVTSYKDQVGTDYLVDIQEEVHGWDCGAHCVLVVEHCQVGSCSCDIVVG